jgi:UDP-N-acetylglucosamine 3-dehydrogenase
MNINVGIIGAGYWGTKLVYEYEMLSKKRPDLNLRGVSDASQEQLRKVAYNAQLQENKLHLDYHKLLNDPRINAVHIATPSETHYQIAMDALKMGKHVLLEKPMALSSREAFKITRLAEEQNLVLLVGHIFRFANAIIKTKELIDAGVFGEINYTKLSWAMAVEPPKNRDIIWDLAPHPIDITNYLLNEWPTRVYARAESYVRNKKGLEEAAFVLVDLPDGKLSSIELSWIQRGPKMRHVTIVGNRATVSVDAINQKIRLYTDDKGIPVDVEKNNTIESMINHFANRIANGDPPRNSALVGSLTVAVLESMRKSIEVSEPVTVVRG